MVEVLREGMGHTLSNVQNAESREKLKLAISRLEIIAPHLSECARILSPITQLGYAYKRTLVQKKRDKQIFSEMSQQQIQQQIQQQESLMLTLPWRIMLMVLSGGRRSFGCLQVCVKKSLSFATEPLEEEKPLPRCSQQRRMYSPSEAYDILSRSSNKLKEIQEIINSGLIAVQKTQMYHLLKKPRALIPRWWNERGRHPIMDDDAINESIGTTLAKQPCRSFGRSEMKDVLGQTQKKQHEAAGFVPLNIIPCNKTVQNYFALIATKSSITAVRVVTKKLIVVSQQITPSIML